MFRCIFLFLLPLVICVTELTDNGGIEYYGTSNVRVQKPYLPAKERPQPHVSLPEEPQPEIATPEQPLEIASTLPVEIIQPSSGPQSTASDVTQPNTYFVPHPNIGVPSQAPKDATSQPSIFTTTKQPVDIAAAPPVADSHNPVGSSPDLSANVNTKPPLVAGPQQPIELAPYIPKKTESQPEVGATQPTIVVYPEESAVTVTPTTIVTSHLPGEFAPEVPLEIDNQPEVTSTQPNETFSPKLSLETASQPDTAAPPVMSFDTENIPVIPGSQPSVSFGSEKQPEQLALAGPSPPAVGSTYPLGPLPPLLPKPKPIREPALNWHSQSTPVYPTPYTTRTPTQHVTKSPPVIVTRSPSVFVPTHTPSKHNGSLKLEFSCKNGNGFYAIRNECDAYIECKQNIAIKYTCPDGLHFNSAVHWNDYPCAYPSVVKCNSGIENLNPRPTHQCPRQYGFFSMNDGDCSKYIMCQGGIATIMNCPAGLAFNPVTDTCDWQENVPQCNPNVFRDFTCPDAPLDEHGYVSDVIYKYKFQNQCKLYIACQRGHPRLLSCEYSLAFDESSQSCINADYVPGCSTSAVYRT